ncbi:MAG: hypothetical protein GKS05_09020 [Nitrospirales bacterium]|nr:hypothetical protein [Nitrospirales bacterium]
MPTALYHAVTGAEWMSGQEVSNSTGTPILRPLDGPPQNFQPTTKDVMARMLTFSPLEKTQMHHQHYVNRAKIRTDREDARALRTQAMESIQNHEPLDPELLDLLKEDYSGTYRNLMKAKKSWDPEVSTFEQHYLKSSASKAPKRVRKKEASRVQP